MDLLPYTLYMLGSATCGESIVAVDQRLAFEGKPRSPILSLWLVAVTLWPLILVIWLVQSMRNA